jgi:hypothetical protein
MECTSIKEAFQKLIPKDVTVIKGRVTSTNPLTIQITNDDKLSLQANLLCVPKHLTNYTVDCNIEGLGNTQITINNELRSGETVYLLRFNEKKRYYILDREG